MQPFTTVCGPGVLFDRDNVDTDQLIPARFMKRSRAEGYGDQLLYDLRFNEDGDPEPDFPLNQVAGKPVLMVAGKNFGCGSSREAAVYALVDYGIRVVVAAGFADIFRGNAAKNGLLTIPLAEADRQRLAAFLAAGDGAATGADLTVDLEAQEIRADGLVTIGFPIDPGLKRRLLLGLDELSETLQDEPAITAFEQRYCAAAPWVVPAGRGARTG